MKATWVICVRWWDGYLERFESTCEPRFGSDLLWFMLEDSSRHIPLRHVRWFSISPGSHEAEKGDKP